MPTNMQALEARLEQPESRGPSEQSCSFDSTLVSVAISPPASHRACGGLNIAPELGLAKGCAVWAGLGAGQRTG